MSLILYFSLLFLQLWILMSSTSKSRDFRNLLFYWRLLGKLNYLTHTRVVLSFTVQHLSQYMHDPREPHLTTALRYHHYLLKYPVLGLFMCVSGCFKLMDFCDSY